MRSMSGVKSFINVVIWLLGNILRGSPFVVNPAVEKRNMSASFANENILHLHDNGLFFLNYPALENIWHCITSKELSSTVSYPQNNPALYNDL